MAKAKNPLIQEMEKYIKTPSIPFGKLPKGAPLGKLQPMDINDPAVIAKMKQSLGQFPVKPIVKPKPKPPFPKPIPRPGYPLPRKPFPPMPPRRMPLPPRGVLKSLPKKRVKIA